MSEARTIKPKGVSDPPEYLDFEELRGEGIRHIQDLSGALWTDHNVHDPGITILEALCYALTDLDYRSKLDIRDLLARSPELDGATDDNFFTAAEILSNNPLSILDYRKLLIDIPGVRNAWLEPAEKGEVDIWIDQQRNLLSFDKEISQDQLKINGLYKVYLEFEQSALTETDACGNTVDCTGDILAEVKRRLHAHRNLCEDFLDIVVLREARISLCADIEIKPDSFPDEVMLGIMEAAREFLSPTLPFYSLRQMIDKGKTPDEIFAGRPLLKDSHGFIDLVDLKRLDLRKEIHISDLYAELLKVPGVSAIKKLTLYNESKDGNKGEDWILPLDPQVRPALAIEESLRGITFFKRGVPFSANASSVKTTLEKHLNNPDKVLKKPGELDLDVPKGLYRADLGEYYSIQHDFPLTYGIGADGLPEDASQKRQAQALQLKGYLLFYDQLLTNYVAQLANLRPAFSTRLDDKVGSAALVGSLDSVPKLNLLIRNTVEAPGDDGYYQNETVAALYEPGAFGTPQDRDFAIEQIVSAFDNSSAKVTVEPNEDQSGYYFVIIVEFGRTLKMRSIKTYPTETDAVAAIERVRFLATLPESYDKTNNPKDKKYSFELAYRPVNYTTYLQQITESPEQYFARKNRFFDHLLRRFAEDFTDYTLLTFALSRKQGRVADTEQFNPRFARDKSAFLSDYPNISRNRGQAFNYTQDPRDGNNISGLERRVERLLAIKSGTSKRLNYFDVAPVRNDGNQYYFEYRDFETVMPENGGYKHNLLFRSRLNYDTAQEAQDAYDTFLITAQNPCNYITDVCPLECTYTFRVMDATGCEIAWHPYAYGSATLRDEIMQYAIGIVQGNGFYHTLASETEGWVFRLKNGAAVLLESARAAQNDVIAKRMFHRAIVAGLEKSNYRNVDEPLGRGYSFEIAADGMALAQHPAYYPTTQERDQAVTDVFKFVKQHKINTKTRQLPIRHRWQLIDKQGKSLLQSIHFFKKNKQTAFAFHLAMTEATRSDNYRKIQTDDGLFTFELLQRRIYMEETPDGNVEERELLTPIGIPPTPFATAVIRDAVMDKVMSLAEDFAQVPTDEWHTEEFTGDHIWSELKLENGKGTKESIPGTFYVEMPDPDDKDALWLAATSRTNTAEDAQIAFYDVLNSVCAGQFSDFAGTDGCPFGFDITNGSGEIIAEHPASYSCKSDRTEAQTKISQWVCAHRFDFEIERIETAYRFEFRRRRCNDQMEIALTGVEKFKTKKEADAAFESTLEILKKIASDPTPEDKTQHPNVGISDGAPYRFWIKNDENSIIAEHPAEYETKEGLEAAVAEFFGLFKEIKAPEDQSTPLKIEIPVCTNSDGSKLDGHVYTWRLEDDEERVARYAQSFPDRSAAEEQAHDLRRKFLCNLPRYTTVWTERDNFTGAEPVVFFALRDLHHCYWRSAIEYPSVAEAQKAFDEQYIDILTLARSPKSYAICRQKDGTWAIQLRNAEGVVVAEACQRFVRKEEVVAETDRLLGHARFFPIVRKDDGFTFRLFDDRFGDILWQSLLKFNSPGAAMKGLKRFLDLLQYEGNYHPTYDGCDWRIEIVEVLLESKPFYSGNAGAEYGDENIAWRRVDQFLDTYSQLNEAIFEDYTDHHHCCGYGFRLVNECYRLARYTASFHQVCDRETTLDSLVQDAICQPPKSTITDNHLLDWLFGPTTSENNKEITLRLAIAKAMRFAGSYSVLTVKLGQNIVYRLGLSDVNGTPFLGFGEKPFDVPEDTPFFSSFTTEDEAIRVIYDHIVAANQIPVTVDPSGEFGFEYRVQLKDDELQAVNGLMTEDCSIKMAPMPVFKTKWISVGNFARLAQAWSAYEQFIKLLVDKNAYARAEAADGSPTLMIIDPAHVIAIHPRTYTTRAQREAAKQNLIAKLNTEGLHLLEHVLLRPRNYEEPEEKNIQGEDPNKLTLLPRILIESKENGASGDTEFEDYIPGADPYSFRTTIVLPYWPRRFRDNDFRTFFENTLRRESPALVMPSIVWIRPQQMKAFEKQFFFWLEHVENDECNRKMLKILEELGNVFIDAFPADCEAGGGNENIIILDKTPIN